MGVLQGPAFNNTNLLYFFDFASPSTYPGTGTTVYDSRIEPSASGLGVRMDASVSAPMFFEDTTGRGMKLNGTSESIGFNNTAAAPSSMTAELWVCYYGSAAGTIWQATYNAASLGAGAYLFMTATRALGVGIFTGGTGPTMYNNNYKLGIGRWHHIAITCQAGTNVIVYLDGDVILNTAWTNNYTAPSGGTTDNHRIGGSPSITGYSPIKIGYYKHYDRVLAASEIAQSYVATRSRYDNATRSSTLPGSTGYGVTQFTQAGTSFSTTDSGVTWTTLVSGSQSYGGRAEYDSFIVLPYSSASRIYNIDLSSFVTDPSGRMRIAKTDRGTLLGRNFGNGVFRSTDGGSVWTQVATLGSSFNSGIHYGNGVCFTSAVNTSKMSRPLDNLVSFDDGVTWHAGLCTGLPRYEFSFAGYSAYINGLHHFWFPGTTPGPNALYVSPNGINWTMRGVMTGGVSIGNNYGDLDAPFYRNGYYHAIASGNLYRSTNGYAWTQWGSATGSSAGYMAPGYINGNWVVAGYTTTVGNIYTCSDPSTLGWTTRYTTTAAASTYYGGSVHGVNQHGPGI